MASEEEKEEGAEVPSIALPQDTTTLPLPMCLLQLLMQLLLLMLLVILLTLVLLRPVASKALLTWR